MIVTKWLVENQQAGTIPKRIMSDQLKANVKADMTVTAPVILSSTGTGPLSQPQFSCFGDYIVKAEKGILFILEWEKTSPVWKEVKSPS